MAQKKSIRKVKKTLLLVGEGFSEKAFLSHLVSLFSKGGYKISITTAKGKGPSNVISHAVSCKKNSGYDMVAVLLDTDLTWPAQKVREAESRKILLIGSTPCLEGLLLDILQQKKFDKSAECKNKVQKMLGDNLTDKKVYRQIFTEEVIFSAAKKIETLSKLISILSKA
ncbi:RloB domain-containing protein [Providencia rettgeri]|uniref:RloB domain-containing protein n=1 Tax=Providencia TaxID=586 RepID=UPI001EE6BF8E|nr:MULTISPECIES: RloB domain-containing protein [Providencia]MCG5371159.1 RloB domain-containing protein [Providencia rettgeri]